MQFDFAPDIHQQIKKIVPKLQLSHIDPEKIICFRSQGSKARALARIWSLPRIWQLALKLTPYYCIEVLSEKFDKLNHNQQTKVLIHELLHIPKNFSGALLPHYGRGKVKINQRTVDQLFRKIKKHDFFAPWQ